MADSSLSTLPDTRQQKRELALIAMNKVIGVDKVDILVNELYVRSLAINDTRHCSLVDVANIFSPDNNDPRIWWNQRKKRLLSLDDELYQSIIQLKLEAEDGKKRLTDLAPIWSCLFIISKFNTPAADSLMKAIFKGVEKSFTVAELKYRVRNIAQGMEWAAETNHAKLKASGALSDPDLYKPDSWNDIIRGGK